MLNKEEEERLCKEVECMKNNSPEDPPEKNEDKKLSNEVKVQESGDLQYFISIPRPLALAFNAPKGTLLRIHFDFNREGLIFRHAEEQDSNVVKVQEGGKGHIFTTIPISIVRAYGLTKGQKLRISIDFGRKGLLFKKIEEDKEK